MIRKKQKWQKIILIIGLCSFITSCGSSEKDPVKVLNEAMEKTIGSNTFKVKGKTYGTSVDLYFTEEENKLVHLDEENETFVKKENDSLYSVDLCYDYDLTDISNLTSIYISKKNSELETHLLGSCTKDLQNGKAVLDFYGESKNNQTNYLYYIQLLLERKDCYTFSIEENNKETTISVKLKEPAKLDELETQRMKSLYPDYDPLISSSGNRLLKNNFIQDEYEFLINDKGFIKEVVYLREKDYGEDLIEKIRTTFSFSDFDNLTINEKEINSLIDQGSTGEIKSGEIFDYSKILS